MVAIRGAGQFTLRDTLEYLEERYQFSELLDRLHDIAIDKKRYADDPTQQKQIDDLVNLLEQAVDQSLEIEAHLYLK